MLDKTTTALIQQLGEVSSVNSFWSKSGSNIPLMSVSDYLTQLLMEKGMKKREVFDRCCLDAYYGYQMFRGVRLPSFDVAVQLAFGLQLSLEETQNLLKTARLCALSPRVKRDAIIIHVLQHGASFANVQEQLLSLGEAPLGGRRGEG